MVYLNILDDDDEYSSDFNMTAQRSDQSPDHTLVGRMDSNSSVDTFMPNLAVANLPRSGSQDMLSRVSHSEPHNLDRQMSLDEVMHHYHNQSDPSLTPKRTRASTVASYSQLSGGRGSPRLLSSASHSLEGSIDESELMSPTLSPGAHGDPMSEPFHIHNSGVRPKQKPIIRTDSQSSGESSGSSSHPSYPGHRQMIALPDKMDLSMMDEQVRIRLNQRRSSGNRRYYTADAIQELRKDKDASIHKRLSWNLGNAIDISIDGERQSILKNKAFSNDSLRSMPSSSGVSSTGSLHLSPDSEICEELENQDIMSQNTSLDTASVNTIIDPQDESMIMMSRSYSNADTHGHIDGLQDAQLTQIGDNKMSKSLPDLHAMVKNNIQDGIGSVQLPQPDQVIQGSPNPGQRRKMTHAQIWKMTSLLLNSTLEAS